MSGAFDEEHEELFDDTMSAELAEELATSMRAADPRNQPARFSHLRAMGRSGQHARAALELDGDDTLSRRLGSGVHAMTFDKPVAKWDQPSKAAREGTSKASGKKPSKAPRNGAEWEAFRLAHAGHVILSGKEHAQATAVSAAIRNHPEARRLLFAPGAVHEQTILWEQLGRARRTTPDARHPGVVVELKTTRDASPERFMWDVRKMFYHAQLADQAAAIEVSTGRRPDSAFIVAIETARPYVVQVYELSKHALEQGAWFCERWLKALIEAERSNEWIGYHPGIVELDVPTEQGMYFDD